MNRRQFVGGIGAATIVASVGGCKSSTTDAKRDSSQADGRSVAMPARTPTPLPPGSVTLLSQMLMVFMLAGTQHGPMDAQYRVESMFPSDGTEPDYANHYIVKGLGVNQDAFKYVVQQLRKSVMGGDYIALHKQIRDKFIAVVGLYDQVFSYGKPDCPSPTALQAIIKVANAQ
jgi:hypothetical protein